MYICGFCSDRSNNAATIFGISQAGNTQFCSGLRSRETFSVEFRQHVLSTMGVKYIWQPPSSPQFRELHHAILDEGTLGSAMDRMVALSQQTTSYSRTARRSIYRPGSSSCDSSENSVPACSYGEVRYIRATKLHYEFREQ
jgi:hypothetical protein